MLSRIGVQLCRGCGDRYSHASVYDSLTLIDQVHPQTRKERKDTAVGPEVSESHRVVALEQVIPYFVLQSFLIAEEIDPVRIDESPLRVSKVSGFP